jgi:hypothetical protein
MEERSMTHVIPCKRSWLRAFTLALILCAWPVAAFAAYPPETVLPSPDRAKTTGGPSVNGGPIFSNTHNYGIVIIRVDVYNNYLGDFTKYWWVYTVTNVGYDPNVPVSNGFSGFELALPIAVPDIGDISAPDGIPPWEINGYSGLPVEWDLRNTPGAPVNGGTLPGQTEQYAFTTSPRLITQSTGWFHTWQNDIQTDIINYPPADAPEVPDVLSEPNQELCCSQDAVGTYICQVLPAGQCDAIGGTVVIACDQCPPITSTVRKTWGKLKDDYR